MVDGSFPASCVRGENPQHGVDYHSLAKQFLTGTAPNRCKRLCYRVLSPTDAPNSPISLKRHIGVILALVDLGLGQRLDDVGTVKETTSGSLGTAQRLATLNGVVVASQVGLGNAAERAAAC